MAGSAILSIRAIFDASRAQRGIRDTESATQRMGTRVRDTLKGVALGFAAGFGADKLVEGIKESITAASDLSETVSKTQQVFGPASSTVLEWSKNSSNAFGQSQTQALDAASTFAVFGKSAGLAGKDLSNFATQNTELASDFASFANTSPEEAVQAFGAAMRGETEPMRKYGLVIDDAKIKQAAFRLGLTKAPNDKLDPAKRALAVNKLIKEFADGQKITGDFARTSGGLANQQRILAAKIENAKAAIGAVLLPAVLAGIKGFSAFGRALLSVGNFVKQNADIFLTFGTILAGFALYLNAARIATVAYTLVARVIGTVTRAWAVVQGILNAVMSANPIALVVLAIVALIAIVVLCWRRFEGFRTVVQAVWGAVKTYISVYIAIIKVAIAGLMAVVRALVAAFRWMLGAARAVWNAHAAAIRAVVSVIRSIISGLMAFFRNIPGWIRGALSTVASVISAPFRAAWNWVRTNVAGPLGRAFSHVVGGIRSALSGVFNAFTSPFRTAWDWVKHNIIDRVSGAFGTVTRGISSIKTAYNAMARNWNGIQVKVGPFKMPGPVPDIPGFTLGLPDLPLLARGGYFDRATAAIVGEGRHDEIVSPVPMLRQIVREELAAHGPVTMVTVNGALDPDAVARQIEKILGARARRVGGVSRAGAFA